MCSNNCRKIFLVVFVFVFTYSCIADRTAITSLFDPERPGLIHSLESKLDLTLELNCVYTPSDNALSYGVDNCGVAPRTNFFGESILTNSIFTTDYKWLKYIKSCSNRRRVDTLAILNKELNGMTGQDTFDPPYERNQMLKISDFIKSFSVPFTFNMDYQSHYFMYFDLFPTATGISIYAERNADREVLETFISGTVSFRREFGNLSEKVQKFSDYHLARYDNTLSLSKQSLASFEINIPEFSSGFDKTPVGLSITNILGKTYSPQIYSKNLNFEQACSWIYSEYDDTSATFSKHFIRQYSEKTGCLFILTYQMVGKDISSQEIVEQLDINVENYFKQKPPIAALPFHLSDLYTIKKSEYFKGKVVAVSGSDGEINLCFKNAVSHPVLGFAYANEHGGVNKSLSSIQKLNLKSISFFTGGIPSRFFYMSNYSKRIFVGQGSTPPVLVIPLLPDEM